MKHISLLALVAFTLALGMAVKVSAAEVVLIGGSIASPPDVVMKAEKTFGGTFVELGKRWPLRGAAKNVLQQLKDKGIDMSDGIVLVGYSWGGLVARQLDADNPGLVKLVITVGSAPGGYRFMPKDLFMPGDSASDTPLYVIGGYDPQIPKKWFMNGTRNDGIVSLESVFTVGRATVAMIAFSGFNHDELMVSREVTEQIREWITPEAHESPEKIISAAYK